MSDAWNILVVDDEKDIHEITRLSMKRRRWKKKELRIQDAYSAQEAQALLLARNPPDFQVAIVDVVMETPTAGLALCQFIRDRLPQSLRIILRTGQPGVAPKDLVLNEYDIDYYFSKPEVTEERLFNAIRACLRSYEDVATLLAFSRQLQGFAQALNGLSDKRSLLTLMREGLRFMELKYNAQLVFVPDLQAPEELLGDPQVLSPGVLQTLAGPAFWEGKTQGPSGAKGRPGDLAENAALVPFTVARGDDAPPVQGLLAAVFDKEFLLGKTRTDFEKDISVFLENWKMAYGTVELQARVAHQKMLREKMYLERMEGLTGMVAGIAHEVNTPLGVIRTSVSMIRSLTGQLSSAPAGSREACEAIGDLNECADLLDRNIDRANHLIQSFKKLSSDQLHDERVQADLVSVVSDCIEVMRPQTKKKGISFSLRAPQGAPLTWHGYPGHLSQVIMNFIQNTIRYGYPDGGGRVEIHFEQVGGERYRIRYVDYGRGIAPEHLGRIFDPFFTTGRGQGGTGLGLAISHNIITNLLQGKITCQSQPGQGAQFSIELPAKIEEPGKAPLAAPAIESNPQGPEGRPLELAVASGEAEVCEPAAARPPSPARPSLPLAGMRP